MQFWFASLLHSLVLVGIFKSRIFTFPPEKSNQVNQQWQWPQSSNQEKVTNQNFILATHREKVFFSIDDELFFFFGMYCTSHCSALYTLLYIWCVTLHCNTVHCAVHFKFHTLICFTLYVMQYTVYTMMFTYTLCCTYILHTVCLYTLYCTVYSQKCLC